MITEGGKMAGLFGRSPGEELVELRKMMMQHQQGGFFNEYPINEYPISPEPVDQPVSVEPKVVVDDEYLALSESVGVDSPVVSNELLKRCLKQEKIFVYNTEHVEKYLRSKFTSTRQMLVWKPLRKKDAGGRQIYNHPIPGYALQRAERVLQSFDRPNDLVFEVSDYEEVKPDPFLSVRLRDSDNRFVIAFWDEPNFRMEE
jgi:hypothetical protein